MKLLWLNNSSLECNGKMTLFNKIPKSHLVKKKKKKKKKISTLKLPFITYQITFIT